MTNNFGETDPSLINEAGKELFNFTENRIAEYISIAELKTQNRLLYIGLDISDNKKSEIIDYSGYQTEMPNYWKTDINSSGLIGNINKIKDEKDILSGIGKSISALTGLNQIFYFKYNEENHSLDGHNLENPEDTEIFNDFSLLLNGSNSIIATSFLMGMDINSLERVETTEPALFDIQLINYMGTEGIYCLPLVDKDKAIGIIVIGVNPNGSVFNREKIIELKSFTESVIPLLSKNKIKAGSESQNKADGEPGLIQTRKLIHEINNPLSAVKNYLKVLSMKLDDINVENDEIRIIDDELNRITKLLKEFKSSPSDKIGAKSISNINGIISDTILLIKNSRGNGPQVNIDFDIDEDIPDIMIDKDAFRQVLINLINNSIEAMPNGGNISVDVRYKNGLHQNDPNAVKSGGEGNRLEITISDNGPGIPDNLKSNLFKKQSSTKADHDGLGLLIVHDLVSKMGGNIVLDDKVDSGACFKILLPAR